MVCIGKIKPSDDERIKSEYIRKFAATGIISDFVSLYILEKDKELQRIIHSIKYSKRFASGIFLGRLTAEKFRERIQSWHINYIVPVPLHRLKKAERGYNQSFYIAKGLSGFLKIPVAENLIKRKRYTESQTKMNLKERQENIEGAFKAKRRHNLNEKNILLVDDVITTGSTISECGKVLLEKGVKKVYAVSVAIAD